MKCLWLVALVALSAHAGSPQPPTSDADKGKLLDAEVHIKLGLQDPGSINYDRFIVYVDRWHFPNRRLQHRSRWAEGLDNCASELYWKLMEFNDSWPYGQTLNPDWLNAEGRRLRDKHAKPQPGPGQPVGGGGGGSPGGGSGRIVPKPQMPRNPNWDGRGPR